MVSVPPRMSPNGKRQQKFFDTQKQAERFCDDLIKGRSTFGDLLSRIDQHQLSEAVRAIELLQPTNVSLLDAVTSFLADHERRSASMTCGQCFDAFQAKPGRSKDYMDSLRHTRARVESLLDRKIIDVHVEDLEKVLRDLPPATRDLRINRLRGMFNYAVKRGWLESSPADRLDFSGKRTHEIQIYMTDEIRRLLDTCMRTDIEFAPYLVLCAFAGLRPENEAFNLDWKDVHVHNVDQPHVVVRAETAKTRDRRTVDLAPNCVAWLDAIWLYRTHGRVFPFSSVTLSRKRAALVKASGVRWIKDGLRHTFASAHMNKFQDATKTMLAMGHKDLKMIWKNYYRHMTQEESERFWSVVPE